MVGRAIVVVLVVVVVLLRGSVGRADDDERARELYQKGTEAFNAGQYQRAAIFYSSAAERFNHPDLIFNLAQALRLSGQVNRALVEYRRYLALSPNGRGAEEARAILAQNGAAPPAPTTPSPPPRRPAPVADDGEDYDDTRRPPPPPPTRPAPTPPSSYNPYARSNPAPAPSYNPYARPNPSAYGEPGAGYPAPPIYSRRLLREQLSVCPLGDGEWAFCHLENGKTVGENAFIERYHQVTGNPYLDQHIDYSWRRRSFSIAGGIFGGFFAMMFVGYMATMSPLQDSTAIGVAFGGLGTAGVLATLLIGFPVAAREPRTTHRMSQEEAQRAVREYNQGLRQQWMP